MKNYHYYGTIQEGKKTVKVAMSGIINEDNTLLSIGIAKCNPKDRFDKKLGRTISLGRAEKNPEITINIANNVIPGKLFVNECKNLLGVAIEDDNIIHADSNDYRERYDNVSE